MMVSVIKYPELSQLPLYIKTSDGNFREITVETVDIDGIAYTRDTNDPKKLLPVGKLEDLYYGIGQDKKKVSEYIKEFTIANNSNETAYSYVYDFIFGICRIVAETEDGYLKIEPIADTVADDEIYSNTNVRYYDDSNGEEDADIDESIDWNVEEDTEQDDNNVMPIERELYARKDEVAQISNEEIQYLFMKLEKYEAKFGTKFPFVVLDNDDEYYVREFIAPLKKFENNNGTYVIALTESYRFVIVPDRLVNIVTGERYNPKRRVSFADYEESFGLENFLRTHFEALDSDPHYWRKDRPDYAGRGLYSDIDMDVTDKDNIARFRRITNDLVMLDKMPVVNENVMFLKDITKLPKNTLVLWVYNSQSRRPQQQDNVVYIPADEGNMYKRINKVLEVLAEDGYKNVVVILSKNKSKYRPMYVKEEMVVVKEYLKRLQGSKYYKMLFVYIGDGSELEREE